MPKKKTQLQKRTFFYWVEKGGSIGGAMRANHYSESMAKNPQKLTNSASWKALADEYFPQARLAAKQAELLDATRVAEMNFSPDTDIKEIQHFIASIKGRLVALRQGVETKISSKGKATMKKALVATYLLPDTDNQVKALDKAYKAHKVYSEGETGLSMKELIEYNRSLRYERKRR